MWKPFDYCTSWAVPDKCGNIIDLTFTIHLSKTSFAFLPKQTQRFGLTKSNSFCNISVYVLLIYFQQKLLDISLSVFKILIRISQVYCKPFLNETINQQVGHFTSTSTFPMGCINVTQMDLTLLHHGIVHTRLRHHVAGVSRNKHNSRHDRLEH